MWTKCLFRLLFFFVMLAVARAEELAYAEPAGGPVSLPSGATVLADIAYGPRRTQRLDVYRPAVTSRFGAPIIVMIHGGGWRYGDKSAAGVVANKAAHWLPQGYIFVSVNHRLLPEAGPATQAEDVALALAFVQNNGRSWGGNDSEIVLMGHSAGAHLAALVAVDADLARMHGLAPWRATVLLDSAAYDVVSIMETGHPPLYDVAFGPDPVLWAKASPRHRLTEAPSPMLLVCSERRHLACPAAHAFAREIADLGGQVQVSEVDLSHREINVELGLPTTYTGTINLFLRSIGLE